MRSRYTSLAALLWVTLVGAGCGGGGGDSGTGVFPPGSTDTPAPFVVRTVPVDDEVVATSTVVSVYYSDALACSTPSRSGTFGEIVGTLNCNNVDGKGLIVLAPAAPLDAGRQYRWAVSGFRGVNGKIAVAHEGQFNTAPAP